MLEDENSNEPEPQLEETISSETVITDDYAALLATIESLSARIAAIESQLEQVNAQLRSEDPVTGSGIEPDTAPRPVHPWFRKIGA